MTLNNRLPFSILKCCTQTAARTCKMKTLHCEVETPIFMPVATHAAFRSLPIESLENIDTGIILANTYHLLLRPGPQVFKKLGGIHNFMNWKKGVLTDSGGFQLFSLTNHLSVSEEGAKFRSYVDGKYVMLSPETSIRTQRAIGSDIMMVLDQCIPSTADHQRSLQSVEITYRWAKRSLAARDDSPQSLFGIVQGACHEDLRRQSAEQITGLGFDGYAIGGLAVGEPRSQREDITELTTSLLPSDRPRYLMGVGTPIDLLEAVRRGVDMFDCILPLALAQQGVCFSSNGKINLSRSVYKFSDDPIDSICSCSTCQHYSRAYLHHLIKAGQYLGGQLIGIHNLHFYAELMRRIRLSIAQDVFEKFYATEKPILEKDDDQNPVRPPPVKYRPQPPKSLGAYELLQQEGRPASIKHRESGEVMHSVNDPVEEANHLYIEQSELRTLLKTSSKEIIIWDVGMGAATNAMCAISAYEKTLSEQPENLAPLSIISFENDLDSLKLALRHLALFPHLRHKAPHKLLIDYCWQANSGRLSWKLMHGDFLKNYLEAPAPDHIFFDPFSAKTNNEFWQYDCLRNIAQHCFPKTTFLYTYSASTAVRATLLASGFFVGRGVGTGPKQETTIACTTPHLSNQQLLDRLFLEKWERSDAKFPSGLADILRPEFSQAIRNHLQFTCPESPSPF